jgi:preprotein translocase subunit SecG
MDNTVTIAEAESNEFIIQATPSNTPIHQQSINFDNVIDEIINDDVLPTVKFDIDNGYKWRYRWKTISNICGAVSQILTGVASILSFVSSSSNSTTYAFLAGIFGVCALFLVNFSTYSSKQKVTKTIEINKYLKMLNLKFRIPTSDDGPPSA